MIKVQTDRKNKILPINDIVDELKAFFILRQSKPYIYKNFVERIDKIIIALESNNTSVLQLFQIMKDIDDLITKIVRHNNDMRNIEKVLVDLKKYTPMKKTV